MVAAEDVDRVGGVLLAAQQRLDVGEHGLLLVGHVAVHLGHVFVVVAHDGERHVAQRAVHGLDELAPDGRQAEIEKITVRVVEVVGQRAHRHPLVRHAALARVHEHVHHGQKGRRIDPVRSAHLGDGFVAEAEGDAETAHDLEHGVFVAHQIAHAVVARIVS